MWIYPEVGWSLDSGLGVPASPCQQQAEKSLMKVCLAGFLPLVILDLVTFPPLGHGACQVEVTPSLWSVSDSQGEGREVEEEGQEVRSLNL